ncbi:unnamed protein product [Closterium sp. NIES-64]|nr:unnamed protein product [Closterium sp. NIES-64]
MMERGLWGLFDGTEKKPDDESGIAAWKKKDQKAFATLISRIGINLVSAVRTCIKLEASAHEAWKRLETMHVNKTLHGKILAWNAFYTVKLRAGESMHEYATRVEELGETFMDLVGSTRLIVDSGPVDVTSVLHVPGVKVNLLSVPQLAKKGVIATIDGAKMNLFWKGEQFAQGVLNGDIYQLKTYPRAASSNVAQGSKATLKAWHNWLAHANYELVKELANKGLAKGVNVIAGDDKKGVCAACVEGKMARKPLSSRTSPLAKDPLALVHMDVCGPMLKGGARFLLVMLDDATRMSRAAIFLGVAPNERAWRVWDLGDKRVVTSRDVVFDEDKFPTKEKPTQQATFILLAREEFEENEVLPQVEKEADEGGENDEESVDDVVEVPPTEAATTSTPSSLPLALTRERREVRPPSKYADYAMVAVGETDKEGTAFCFATKGDDEHAESLMEPPPKDPSPRVAVLPASPCSQHALLPASLFCSRRPAAHAPCSPRRNAACDTLQPVTPYFLRCPAARIALQPARLAARVALQPTRPAACVALQPARPAARVALLPARPAARALPCLAARALPARCWCRPRALRALPARCPGCCPTSALHALLAAVPRPCPSRAALPEPRRAAQLTCHYIDYRHNYSRRHCRPCAAATDCHCLPWPLSWS